MYHSCLVKLSCLHACATGLLRMGKKKSFVAASSRGSRVCEAPTFTPQNCEIAAAVVRQEFRRRSACGLDILSVVFTLTLKLAPLLVTLLSRTNSVDTYSQLQCTAQQVWWTHGPFTSSSHPATMVALTSCLDHLCLRPLGRSPASPTRTSRQYPGSVPAPTSVWG